ncbi:MAG: choice-of-anchor B family protein [Chitinophagales bacterium]|nr:choice-of-anchor B family protein [Chitinophagales bacterium]
MKHLFILAIILVSIGSIAQNNIRFRDMLGYPVQLSSLWGYADTANSKEYALVGTYNGLSIVDVTNPDSVYEVQFISGPSSTWREVKTWSHYAYATNETSDGLLIVDLSSLPAAVNSIYWTAGAENLSTGHTLFIDNNGYLYVNGFNVPGKTLPTDMRGVLMADLNANPMNPTVVGKVQGKYVHDSFTRNDTLWTANIYNGIFQVYDVSNKANPILLADQQTPNSYTHNCWLSDDGNVLFTTDEKGSAFITSYDVSNLGNITELDRYQSEPGSGLIPHNVHVVGRYLVNAYYKAGVTIADAQDPANIIEVGNYDTSPFLSEDGFAGTWGVYPYLPSGTILTSDMEEGLFVLTPTYTPACYLQGVITNQSNGAPLSNVNVQIVGNDNFDLTNFNGEYATGVRDAGFYDVRVSQSGCASNIIAGVKLQHDSITVLNATIDCVVGINDLLDDNAFIKTYYSAGETVMAYSTGEFIGNATLEVYTVQGALVRSINIPSGKGTVKLDEGFSSGMYLLDLQMGGTHLNHKMLKP